MLKISRNSRTVQVIVASSGLSGIDAKSQTNVTCGVNGGGFPWTSPAFFIVFTSSR
jgi:hypothetical protein